MRTCWQACANGCNKLKSQTMLSYVQTDETTPNLVGTCCVCLHVAKSLTGFKLCTITPNNTQQHATACNRVCKRTQHVTYNNVGSCLPKMLRPRFARGTTLHFVTNFVNLFAICPSPIIHLVCSPTHQS